MNTEPRNNDWIQTFSGRQFWPLDPRSEDVCIEDVAHALALMCRFTGHCRHFYSVAQHSVLVSRLVEKLWNEHSPLSPYHPAADELEHSIGGSGRHLRVRYMLWGLLHDASEAYLHDLPRPLKRAADFGDIYKRHEARLMLVICNHFGLPHCEPALIKKADTILLLTEQRDLMGRQAKPWKDQAEPLPEVIEPWDPVLAEHEFLCRFHDLADAVSHE